eukprot:7985528-Ditylum_brightwellii.AAC.1
MTLSKAYTLKLCQLMADVKLKADSVYLDVHASAKVFKDTFIIKDVIHAVVDDELEGLEKEAQTATDASPYEDDSEDEEL